MLDMRSSVNVTSSKLKVYKLLETNVPTTSSCFAACTAVESAAHAIDC
jgi:hypothetical protein